MAQLLQEAGIDFRDCLERRELTQRLAAVLPSLPRAARARLDALLSPSPSIYPPSADLQPPYNAGRDAGGSVSGAAGAAAGPASAPSAVEPAADSGRGLFVDEEYVVSLFQRFATAQAYVCPNVARAASLFHIILSS